MATPIGKKRTLSVRVDNLDKARLFKTKEGKVFLNLETWDYDEADKFGNHFSVSLPRNEAEKKSKEEGVKENKTFVGNGKIWKPIQEALTKQDEDDLPF